MGVLALAWVLVGVGVPLPFEIQPIYQWMLGLSPFWDWVNSSVFSSGLCFQFLCVHMYAQK